MLIYTYKLKPLSIIHSATQMKPVQTAFGTNTKSSDVVTAPLICEVWRNIIPHFVHDCLDTFSNNQTVHFELGKIVWVQYFFIHFYVLEPAVIGMGFADTVYPSPEALFRDSFNPFHE